MRTRFGRSSLWRGARALACVSLAVGAAGAVTRPPTASIQLVLWKSSQFSIKTVTALAQKGLLPDVDYTLVNGPDARSKEAKEKLLPAPYQIPVLIWGKEVISGSENVCAFLDEQIPDNVLVPSSEVRQLEERVSSLYWPNGFLSIIDRGAFDRCFGNSARQYIKDTVPGGSLLLKLAAGPVTNLLHVVVCKDFRDTMRRRGSPIADEPDIGKIQALVQTELAALDELLAASPTPYFCGSAEPTAADLTLFAMLERWVGDSLQPGEVGAAQPAIIDNHAAVRQAYAAMRSRFETINLNKVKSFADLEEPIGPTTYPPPA